MDDSDITRDNQRTDDLRRQQRQQLDQQLEDDEAQRLLEQRATAPRSDRSRGDRHAAEDSTLESTFGAPREPSRPGISMLSTLPNRRLLMMGALLLTAAVAVFLWLRPANSQKPPRAAAPSHAVVDLAPLAQPLEPSRIVPVGDSSPAPATAGLPTTAGTASPQGAPSLGQMLAMQTTITASAEDTKSILGITRHTDEIVTALQGEISQIKEMLAKVLERPQQVATVRRVSAPPAPKLRPAMTAARAETEPAPAPRSEAQLLSVDVWDGKPSVALSSMTPGDNRVRFVAEGDSNAGVTLRNADPRTQRATFDVAGRQVTLERLIH